MIDKKIYYDKLSSIKNVISEKWKNKKVSRSKTFFSKLSKAFMLPVAILPFAGLLLGIGTTIATNTAGDAQVFGNLLSSIGDVAFANLPVLFAISIAITFTDDSGVAGLSAFFGYIIFNVFISSFLIKEFNDISDPNIQTGWTLWFWQNVHIKQVTNVLGTPTLNSGVFGGIFIGCVVAWVYNKFHEIEFPPLLGFFSGDRIIPILSAFFAILTSVLFIIIWPGFGWMLNKFGLWTTALPGGLDSFIQGFITRSLIPFGLHHVFYAPMWWSSSGGSLINYQNTIVVMHTTELLEHANATAAQVADFKNSIDPKLLDTQLINAVSMWTNTNGFTAAGSSTETWFNSILPATWDAEGDQVIQQAIFRDPTLKIQDVQAAGLRPGRFISGGYPMFMMVLPTIALTMWFTLSKANRKTALGIYAPAAAIAFLTGITEPIEFTILFTAPWLYYGIYVPIAATSWMLTNVSGVSISVTFSQGVIDFILYGIVPMVNGHLTKFYYVFLIGGVLSAVAAPTFYLLITKFNLPLPGKELATNVDGKSLDKLVSKKDYLKSKEQNKKKSTKKDIAPIIVEALGGKDNIINVNACALRLRTDVKDVKKINEFMLKTETNAIGVVISGKNIQTIYGPAAEGIRLKVTKFLKEVKK